jgi:hypothetical protein
VARCYFLTAALCPRCRIAWRATTRKRALMSSVDYPRLPCRSPDSHVIAIKQPRDGPCERRPNPPRRSAPHCTAVSHRTTQIGKSAHKSARAETGSESGLHPHKPAELQVQDACSRIKCVQDSKVSVTLAAFRTTTASMQPLAVDGDGDGSMLMMIP